MEIDIYKYDDFRQWLRDAVEAIKKEDASFSYRHFAEIAEVKNPGTLLDVIQGKRALSSKVQEACVKVFGLKTVQAEFFRLLVQYHQARNITEKADFLRELQNRRAHSSFVRLNTAQVRYYEDTAYALVLSATEALDFRGDYQELASFLRPSLPLVKVKKCVRELCDWGLLRQDSSGQYLVVSRFLEPPSTLKEPVRRMNRDWILQSAEALLEIPAKERQISSSIIAVSEATRKKILDCIEKMRHEIFDLAEADTAAETVMQLSIQYYPKSQTRRRKPQ
jgi:uncharacterized protein (TIGR02147 family)